MTHQQSLFTHEATALAVKHLVNYGTRKAMTTLFNDHYTDLGNDAMEYYPSINITHGDSAKISSWYATALICTYLLSLHTKTKYIYSNFIIKLHILVKQVDENVMATDIGYDDLDIGCCCIDVVLTDTDTLTAKSITNNDLIHSAIMLRGGSKNFN